MNGKWQKVQSKNYRLKTKTTYQSVKDSNAKSRRAAAIATLETVITDNEDEGHAFKICIFDPSLFVSI
ncbi:hypothetical protein FACS189413_11420 [Bacteroidia bacterium]|nr:hypothetical protein FACS189413_11420 [Bacteroidia bacterium]